MEEWMDRRTDGRMDRKTIYWHLFLHIFFRIIVHNLDLSFLYLIDYYTCLRVDNTLNIVLWTKITGFFFFCSLCPTDVKKGIEPRKLKLVSSTCVIYCMSAYKVVALQIFLAIHILCLLIYTWEGHILVN